MGQFVGAIKGIGEACLALDMPIVSGNVSLYNETDGTGILPTPTIAAVGLLKSLDELIAGQPAEGDLAVVIGETKGHLGQSALLAEAFGREEGDAPHVDLAAERRNGEFLRANRKLVRAATDLSDGGLALAAFEMAEAAGLGVATDLAPLTAAAKAAGVPLALVGQFGGNAVRLDASSAPLADLSRLYRAAFETALF
jgi:phosphoribosylformylglycinamidine synthase